MCLFLVSGAVSKQLVRIDSKYAALFNDGTWKDSTADRLDMSARFGLYFVLAIHCFFKCTQSHCQRTLQAEGHSAANWGIGGSV